MEFKKMKSELEISSEDKYTDTLPRDRSTRRKKDYVSIKLDDMMALLATYSKLKARNLQLAQELSFYYQ